VNVVSGAVQEFANVGDHVGVAIDAQDASSHGHGLFGLDGLAIERGYGAVLRFVGVKQLRQMRELQHFPNVFGYIAEFQVAVHLARAGQSAHHGSQAAAVDEHHLAEMQHDGAPVAQHVGHMSAQGFDFTAGHQAAFAAHNGDSPHVAGFQG
jgi:hypothetical protein